MARREGSQRGLMDRRVLLAAVVSAAVLLGGCGTLKLAPYNGRESCQGVGGIYTADGRCLAGNA